MTDYQRFYRNEEDYPLLDGEGACRRLSAAITCRTVNGTPGCDEEFAKLRQLVHDSYPAVSAAAVTEIVGRSLLIHIEGRDKNLKPVLFMSHMDVVGVEAGTEKDWTYPPFSGEIAQGYIWGRGALDIKCQVFGVLEAAEYLLSRGCRPERDVYLAFGEDEETFNTGALAMAKLLESRGVQLEFLLDEGGSIESGAVYCAPGVNVCQIHLAEKGYADLNLTAKGKGGHSSNPFGGSSLEHISRAITAVCDSAQEAEMPKALEQCLKAIAPYVTEEPLKSLVEDIPGNAAAIMEYCASVRELFPLTATTIAPTMISGGSPACNVLPQDIKANINFRLIPGDSVEELKRRCFAALEGMPVKAKFDQANDPSRLSAASGYGYEKLLEAMNYYYNDVVFIPSISAGATDARQYENICPACLRCAPFLSEATETAGLVHGTNERISRRSYIQGIRVLIRIMENSCGFCTTA